MSDPSYDAMERGYDYSSAFICPKHIDDSVLQALIQEHATEQPCSYCGVGSEDNPAAASLDDFMEGFMRGVHLLYVRANDDGVPWDEGDYVLATVRDSWDVAETIFTEHALFDYIDDVGAQVLSDIQEVVINDAWADRDWCWLSPSDRMLQGWGSFKDLVKHERRFWFMNRSRDRFAGPDEVSPIELFDELATHLRENADVRRVLRSGVSLYRGRMADADADPAKYSASDLGPAPREKAVANRMSPAGISMFYGSGDIDTAIAEISGHSNRTHAIVGRFEPARDLHVIDLTNIAALPSIFSEDAEPLYHRIRFLQRFVEDVTLPIELDGREHIDYVPTQVFTEFLRFMYPEPVDGMVFPSARSAGQNIVIFCEPHQCSLDTDRSEETLLVFEPASVQKLRVPGR
jgi:hypothetical protein